MIPVVAIVGRPNVGKSTLFNRLAGARLAVVHDAPGTTRDRLVVRVTWDGISFILVDTGGLTLETEGDLEEKVQAQVQVALEDADHLLFLTNAATGLHPDDMEAANLLRRQGRTVTLAANKCEGPGQELASAEFYRLGLGDPIPISALHNQGIGDLMDQVVAQLPPEEPEEEQRQVMKLALVGRPNMGKSSLLNAMVGEERSIVHPEPGTTRDAIDMPVTYRDHPIVLIDTAGLRRRGRIRPGLDKFSALRVFQTIERCDVAILLLDATEPVSAQDTHIAGYVVEAFRGLVIAVNKWDLVQGHGASQAEAREVVRERLRWAPYVPVRFTSALTAEGVPGLLDTALEAFQARRREVSQEKLDRMLLDTVALHPTPSRGRRHLRIYKVAQSGINPPTFTFHVNDPSLLHFSYERFLQNTLRSTFGFPGSLLRLNFRRGSPPRKRTLR